mmetsp:Transcript_34910/g.26062  ORF Transcript_34910/g.26062 Transcript_34910/m.26062 type:complete len:101 (+) Transcript_34910:801-1103(+)
MQVPSKLFTGALDKEKRALSNENSEEEKEENEEEKSLPSIAPPEKQVKGGQVGQVVEVGIKEKSIIKLLIEAKKLQQLQLDNIAEFHVLKDKNVVHMMFT